MPTDYRRWMREHGVVAIHKRHLEGQRFILEFDCADGMIALVSTYEHGPDDHCANRARCGGGMPGAMPLEGTFQVAEYQIDARGGGE